MSWFQDLAGKAENILNQIDKNAATVLLKADVPKEVRLEIQQNDVAPKVIEFVPSPRRASKPAMSMKRTTSSVSMDGSRRSPEIVVERIGSSEQAYPMSNSNSTSRRSSLSSRADLMAVADSDGDYKDEPSNSRAISQLGTTEAKSALEDALERLVHMQARANAAELEVESVRSELSKTTEVSQNNISALEAKLLKLTQSEEELRQQWHWSKQESEQAKIELAQYRSRAQSTLLMKDKLIEQLKLASDSHQLANADPIRTEHLEMEHWQNEKAGLLEQTQTFTAQITELRGYVAQLESTIKVQQDEYYLKLDELNQSTLGEEARLREYESQNKVQLRELLMVREEMAKLQTDCARQLHEKDSELARLRSVRPSSAAPKELEHRLHALTQSLVQKQTALESVTADRNALRFQLEKADQEHRQTVCQLRQQRPLSISPNDTDDAKARLPMFMQATPFDTGVSRRVKQVYSSLDGVGVRMGVFLRRYPLIRILTVFYVVLLHLWVMVVLCTSAPNANIATGQEFP